MNMIDSLLFDHFCLLTVNLTPTAEAQNAELSELVHSVSSWWPEFVATTKKLDGVEEQLSEDRPLAGSVPVVEKQDKVAQVHTHIHTHSAAIHLGDCELFNTSVSCFAVCNNIVNILLLCLRCCGVAQCIHIPQLMYVPIHLRLVNIFK